MQVESRIDDFKGKTTITPHAVTKKSHAPANRGENHTFFPPANDLN